MQSILSPTPTPTPTHPPTPNHTHKHTHTHIHTYTHTRQCKGRYTGNANHGYRVHGYRGRSDGVFDTRKHTHKHTHTHKHIYTSTYTQAHTRARTHTHTHTHGYHLNARQCGRWKRSAFWCHRGKVPRASGTRVSGCSAALCMGASPPLVHLGLCVCVCV